MDIYFIYIKTSSVPCSLNTERKGQLLERDKNVSKAYTPTPHIMLPSWLVELIQPLFLFLCATGSLGLRVHCLSSPDLQVYSNK